MAFLKTLFWVIVAVIVVLLWQSSPRVDLPVGSEEADGVIINSRLGTWIILSFLAGFIPLYLYHRAQKWRLKRRIRTLEAQVTSQAREMAQTERNNAEEARNSGAEIGQTTTSEPTEPPPAPRPKPLSRPSSEDDSL